MILGVSPSIHHASAPKYILSIVAHDAGKVKKNSWRRKGAFFTKVRVRAISAKSKALAAFAGEKYRAPA
jgi:hypothetical protein